MSMSMDIKMHMTVNIKTNAAILWNTNININHNIDNYVKVELTMNKHMYDRYSLCEDIDKYDWWDGQSAP